MSFTLSSPSFRPNHAIPRRHAWREEGANIAPTLTWRDAPTATREFCLICEDPDAPDHPWAHWLVYGIPATATRLDGTAGCYREGRNDYGAVGWGGPCPPVGDRPHRYVFRLYALDRSLGVESGIDLHALRQAMYGHVIAYAELIGVYERTVAGEPVR